MGLQQKKELQADTHQLPFIWGWQGFWRLYPDGRIPFSRREDDDLIQKLVNASKEILSVLGFVRNFMEDLDKRTVITGQLSLHNPIQLIHAQLIFFFLSGTSDHAGYVHTVNVWDWQMHLQICVTIELAYSYSSLLYWSGSNTVVWDEQWPWVTSQICVPNSQNVREIKCLNWNDKWFKLKLK